jgi:uncharacterized membrane protein
MLLYLLKVLDNSWSLAVVLPALLFLRGIDARKKFAGAGLKAAVLLGAVAALVYAILKRNTGWVVREWYDIALLWPLLAAFLFFLVFLFPAFRTRKTKDAGDGAGVRQAGRGYPPDPAPAGPGAVLRFASFAILFFLSARVLPDLFVFPLDFDVGMDSVFNMEYLGFLSGYLFGLLALVLLFGAVSFLISGTPRRFLPAILFLSALAVFGHLAVDAVRIMYVRGLLPNYRFLPKVIIFFMGRENFFVFLQVLVWAPAALLVLAAAATGKPRGENPALLRKSRHSLRLKFRAAVFLLSVLAFLVFSATYLRALQARGPHISEPEPRTAVEGYVFLPFEEIGDGNLHRYSYETEGGTIVRFIVVKKTAAAYGVGLDACDICGETGYYQRGDQVICKLCDVVMNKSTIGFPGGCNPVPLDFEIVTGGMRIDPENLEREKRRFQ